MSTTPPCKSCGSPFSGLVRAYGVSEPLCLPCFSMLTAAYENARLLTLLNTPLWPLPE